MGLDVPAEETPVILAGLHHHREIGQLGGTVIDIQAIKIVLNNAGHRLPGGVAIALVNLHEYIEQIGQDMPDVYKRQAYNIPCTLGSDRQCFPLAVLRWNNERRLLRSHRHLLTRWILPKTSSEQIPSFGYSLSLIHI